MSICKIENCDRKVVGRGMCSAHWQRWKKGKPLDLPIETRAKGSAARILAYTRQEGECLVWTGGVNNRGYGYISSPDGDGSRLAHRVAWEHYTGETLEAGDVIHHKCSTKPCIRYEHLQKTSGSANSAEMLERNSYIRRIALLEAEVLRLGGTLPA